MIRRLCSCAALMLALTLSYGQADYHYIDSLEDIAKTQKGVEKINTLLTLSDEFKKLSPDESITKAEMAEQEAEKLKDEHLIAKTNLKIAQGYIKLFDFDLAEKYLHKAINNIGDEQSDLTCQIYNELASVNHKTGNVDSAAYFYGMSRDIAKTINNSKVYADALNNLALISRSKGDDNQALNTFSEAVQVYRVNGDSLAAARTLNNIAMIYSARQQYDTALSLFRQILPYVEKNGENNDLAMTYSNLGLVMSRHTNNIDTALLLFEKAKHCAVLDNDSIMMVDILLNEGDILLLQGDFDTAFDTFNEVKNITERLMYNEGLAATYVRLAEGYYMTADYSKSVENIIECMALEKKSGASLYTPLLKPYLMMNYAHLSEFDSLESEIVRRERDYNNLLDENLKMEIENANIDPLIETNEMLQSKVTKMQYVAIGLATLLLLLVVYTIVISGKTKDEGTEK